MSVKSRAKRTYKRDWHGRFASTGIGKRAAKHKAARAKRKSPQSVAARKAGRAARRRRNGGLKGHVVRHGRAYSTVIAGPAGYGLYTLGTSGSRKKVAHKKGFKSHVTRHARAYSVVIGGGAPGYAAYTVGHGIRKGAKLRKGIKRSHKRKSKR